jgi:hypothetical protein
MIDMAERHAIAQRYVDKIRNPAKRRHAVLYLRWLRNGRAGLPPVRDARELSYMGAQAVEMHLAKMAKPDPEIRMLARGVDDAPDGEWDFGS